MRSHSSMRRPAHRAPSGLRSSSLGQESLSESVAAAAATNTTTTTTTCSTPCGDDTADDSAPNNVDNQPLSSLVASGDGESLLSWRHRTNESNSVDGASDNGALRSASFDSRRNMTLQQLQRAIKSIMVSDSEMYAKLQAGLQGIGSLARETHQLSVNRDATGATYINQYVVVKTLGRGSYGKVKLCLNTMDGKLYAIKMMNRSFLLRMLQRPKAGLRKGARRSMTLEPAAAAAGLAAGPAAAAPAAPTAAAAAAPGAPAAAAAARPPPAAAAASSPASRAPVSMDEVSKEIAILKKLDHPNVVKLYEVIDPPGSQYMMLVMEYLEKGPVLQTRDQAGFDRLPEEVAADYFRQAMKGLEYLHYHRVVHGDIKPENLLVSSSGDLKISDFGCSRMADGKTAPQRLSGTPAFTAPELVAGTSSDPFAADVWAMGACLYCMLYGQLPFQGGSVLDIFKAISVAPLELPPDVPISPDLSDLFSRLFDKDPATRITVPGIMSHPWVTDGGQLQLSQLCWGPASGDAAGAPSSGESGGGGGSFGNGPGFGTIEVTAQEQQGAIDRASLVSMIRARLKEKTFRSGEYLCKQGQTTNCVYFIMSGAVEVLRTAETDADSASLGVSTQSFTIDIDESLTLDCGGLHGGSLAVPMGVINGRLHIDRAKARDLRHRHRTWMDATVPGIEVVVEVKGPGQVVGEVILEDVPPPCRYGARARGDVIALKLTQENYVRALAAMYFEAESGARATASTGGGGFGGPLASGGFAVGPSGGSFTGPRPLGLGAGLSPVASRSDGGLRSDGGGAASDGDGAPARKGRGGGASGSGVSTQQPPRPPPAGRYR